MLTEAEWAGLETAIQQAIEWLDSEHPDNAVSLHRAVHSKIGPLSISLLLHMDGEGATFVFDHEERIRRASGIHGWDGFTHNDLQMMHAAVAKVATTCNLCGTIYGPFLVAVKVSIGNGLLRALENYHAGGVNVFRKEWWYKHDIPTTKPKGWA